MTPTARAQLVRDPLFREFVRLSHERYGERRRTVQDAASDQDFVEWFLKYLADGCGIVG